MRRFCLSESKISPFASAITERVAPQLAQLMPVSSYKMHGAIQSGVAVKSRVANFAAKSRATAVKGGRVHIKIF